MFFFKKNAEILTTVTTKKVLKISGLKLVIFPQKEKHLRVKTTKEKEQIVKTDLLVCRANNQEFIDANGEYFAICSRAFMRGTAKTLMGRIIYALSKNMRPEDIIENYIDGDVIDVTKARECIVDFEDISMKNGDACCNVEVLSDFQNQDALVISIVGKNAAKKAASANVQAAQKQPKAAAKRIKKKKENGDNVSTKKTAATASSTSEHDTLDHVADSIDADEASAQ